MSTVKEVGTSLIPNIPARKMTKEQMALMLLGVAINILKINILLFGVVAQGLNMDHKNVMQKLFQKKNFKW